MATGSFPYKNCRTDFEVLTRVLEEDPPSLSANSGFSKEFRDFVCSWWETVLFVEATCTVHESWVTLLTSARLQFDEGLREATQVRRAAARPLHPALRERVGRRGAVVLAGATDDSGGASECCKDRARSLMRRANTWHAIRSGVFFVWLAASSNRSCTKLVIFWTIQWIDDYARSHVDSNFSRKAILFWLKILIFTMFSCVIGFLSLHLWLGIALGHSCRHHWKTNLFFTRSGL